jgi:DNA-binding FadR family transcriptional regulator
MVQDGLDRISSQNLNDLITTRLRQFILTNKLQAGDKLPSEETLARRLGVSRTATREALRSLEALGMVEARQGYGRVVCEFSFKPILNNLSYGLAFRSNNILQAIEIRRALDAYFIEPAIANLTPEDIAELTELVESMAKQTAGGLPITEEDYRFHAILYRCVDNSLALELFEITWALRLNVFIQNHDMREKPPGTALDHAMLLDAIKGHDVLRARELILSHHANTIELFKERIDTQAQQALTEVMEKEQVR